MKIRPVGLIFLSPAVKKQGENGFPGGSLFWIVLYGTIG